MLCSNVIVRVYIVGYYLYTIAYRNMFCAIHWGILKSLIPSYLKKNIVSTNLEMFQLDLAFVKVNSLSNLEFLTGVK